MAAKLPVIIAGTNCLSGVTTWADELRTLLADDPHYEVRLLYVGPEHMGDERFDVQVRTIDAAHQAIRSMAPAILVPNYLWELYLAGFEPNVSCLGMCHADSDEQYYGPLSWYEPMISQFIAVSRECAGRLTQRIPLRAEHVTMLPYGIRVPRELNRDYITDPLRLVYAGRVTQLQKRVWDFMPLVEQLVKARVHFVFDVIGEGDQFAPLLEAMQARFPARCVHFHGRLPHDRMPDVWAGHDVFLQVSDFEGTSVSMLESMAHGVVPVVTAASSGIDGVIRDGRNGFVVPIGDMAAMAQVIGRLAADRSLLAHAGSAAHQTAQGYSLELYRGKFTAVLDQIVQAGHEVDFGKRYGMFASAHPLFKQQNRILQQQAEITQLRKNAVKILLSEQYERIVPRKLQRFVRKLRGRETRRAA
jgi:glycosyltransferase involved in cell wall biosynthesis